ncbi:hypothetical protein [Bradyrhizobium sp. CW1]|uniref:ATP-dependent DNA ligase n=1 Tax=Bradyrhizobium sp. CW1 TaxID=2782686 RepID=UPI00320B83F4
MALPTKAKLVPAGHDWIHEIKYDGYRLQIIRDGDRVRLLTKNGQDWTKRFPWIGGNGAPDPATPLCDRW